MTYQTPDRAVSDAMREWSRAKAPTTKAKAIAAAVTGLPTMEQVTEFVRRIRVHAGVQDPTMLPDETFTVSVFTANEWKPTATPTMPAKTLISLLGNGVSEFRISWPDVFQNGTAVFYRRAGVRYRAATRDFGPTETYLSM